MFTVIVVVAVCLLFGTTSLADTVTDITGVFTLPDGKKITGCYQGGQLSNVPNYDWWYGCSPTATGMMVGYYDNKGYPNLVPGGLAELNSFPSTPGSWDYISQNAIASPRHVYDFYSGGYQASGDDVPGTWHNVYQGGFTRLAWNEKDLGGTYQIREMRLRFHNGGTSLVNIRLCETDFWEENLGRDLLVFLMMNL
jgi:hypothetical protein